MTQSMRHTPKKILLVDGYNVIRAGHLYEHLTQRAPDHSQDAFNAAREALLGDVASFAGREYQATVVFDGAGNPGSEGKPVSFGTIEYLFSPHGVSADTIIENLAHRAADAGKEVTVVTSDATLQWTVFGRSVVRMSAAGFCDEVDTLRKNLESRASVQPEGTTIKNTLGERIDPRVARALERYVRGEAGFSSNDE